MIKEEIIIGDGTKLSQSNLQEKQINPQEKKHPLQATNLNSSPPHSAPKKDPRKIMKQSIESPQTSKRPGIEDYVCICSLGRGSYGEVVLGKQKSNDQQFAIKIIDKKFMAKEKKQYQVFVEREMLFNFKYPGIVHLYQTFQTNEKLYFVMEYLEGGDFAEFIKLQSNNLSFDSIQFYLAEIVSILEFLHSKGVAHRDVKPENILLDKEGHLKMIDFGTASIFDYSLIQADMATRIKDIKSKYKPTDNPQLEIFGREDENKQRATFVGTAEYVSPELLEDDICQGPADLWALGCICYKLFTGKTPFHDNSEYLVFQNVKSVNYKMPENIPIVAQSLIKSLLVRDPAKRLGAGQLNSPNDYTALKAHEFFKGIDFTSIWTQSAPQYKSIKSIRNETFLDPDLQMGKPNETKKKSRICFYGLVQLKTGWFIYKPLDLVLYEGKQHMTLIFYDPETQANYAKIRLDDTVRVISPKKGYLHVVSNNKTMFVIKEIEHPVEQWLEIIEKSLKDKNKQSKQ